MYVSIVALLSVCVCVCVCVRVCVAERKQIFNVMHMRKRVLQYVQHTYSVCYSNTCSCHRKRGKVLV